MTLFRRLIGNLNDALAYVYDNPPPHLTRPKCGLCDGLGFLPMRAAPNAFVTVHCPMCDTTSDDDSARHSQ